MNTKSLTQISFAILGLTSVLTIGCRKSPTALVSDHITSETVSTTSPSQPALQGVTASEAEAASTRWTDLKEITYDSRAQFFAGLQKLEARVDEQIGELNAKRAAMNSTVDTKNWDFAMKEMVNARAYLKSTGEDLRKADPETWNQLKDKVGQAWVRTQDAYGKVKASTTIL